MDSVLTEKSKLTIGVGAAIAVLTTVSFFSSDYTVLKESVASNRKDLTVAERTTQLNQNSLEKRLDRIEDKLDRIIERGVK